ncbi:hypothetical protein QVD17_16321 [Tagetes erecta]|uniref:Mitochondrial protein n=1 Tax=Tagetes erecta TaxID=13708 RepID=A0AAD8KXM1_TARER|nr:hypothetical protein QVD17_16321 [Tagetes erecta]
MQFFKPSSVLFTMNLPSKILCNIPTRRTMILSALTADTPLGVAPHGFKTRHVTTMKDGLLLSQPKYAHDNLDWAGLLDSKPTHTPFSAYESFSSTDTPYHDVTKYRSFVVTLQYLTIIRPDISYAVNKVKSVFTSSDKLSLPVCHPKKSIAHKRAKHIDFDYHFIRELVSSDKLYTNFISFKLQVAGIFTKSLPRPQFEQFHYALGTSYTNLVVMKKVVRNYQNKYKQLFSRVEASDVLKDNVLKIGPDT